MVIPPKGDISYALVVSDWLLICLQWKDLAASTGVLPPTFMYFSTFCCILFNNIKKCKNPTVRVGPPHNGHIKLQI